MGIGPVGHQSAARASFSVETVAADTDDAAVATTTGVESRARCRQIA